MTNYIVMKKELFIGISTCTTQDAEAKVLDNFQPLLFQR